MFYKHSNPFNITKNRIDKFFPNLEITQESEQIFETLENFIFGLRGLPEVPNFQSDPIRENGLFTWPITNSKDEVIKVLQSEILTNTRPRFYLPLNRNSEKATESTALMWIRLGDRESSPNYSMDYLYYIHFSNFSIKGLHHFIGSGIEGSSLIANLLHELAVGIKIEVNPDARYDLRIVQLKEAESILYLKSAETNSFTVISGHESLSLLGLDPSEF